jgi:hypothetical protein
MDMKPLWVVALAASFAFGLTACEKQGTLERAGEEVDEAVDTMKHGEESTGNKLDDAVDEVREGANDAADEVRD